MTRPRALGVFFMFGMILNRVLQHPGNYIQIQRVIGADRLRKRCIDLIQPHPHDCILDIGCGPAQILNDIPWVRQYYGFDTEKKYIDYAAKKYQGRGHFYACEFNAAFLESATLETIDKVFLMGIFHHISDAAVSTLLQTIDSVLKPGGRIITLDPCFTPDQSFFSQWIAKNDRGKFIRDESGYLSLMNQQFTTIDSRILNNTCRIPSTEIIMLAVKPE